VLTFSGRRHNQAWNGILVDGIVRWGRRADQAFNHVYVAGTRDCWYWGRICKEKKGFTGKSLSEALIFASTNPQNDDRLFIELQVQYMKIPCSNLGRTCCVQKLFLTFRTIFVHNMFSPCSAKRRASDIDSPVSPKTGSTFDELIDCTINWR
jgi:hypothetical protein